MVCGVRILHKRVIHTEKNWGGTTWQRLFSSVGRDTSDLILASAVAGGIAYKDPARKYGLAAYRRVWVFAISGDLFMGRAMRWYLFKILKRRRCFEEGALRY